MTRLCSTENAMIKLVSPDLLSGNFSICVFSLTSGRESASSSDQIREGHMIRMLKAVECGRNVGGAAVLC